jgi:hypothetical protein
MSGERFSLAPASRKIYENSCIDSEVIWEDRHIALCVYETSDSVSKIMVIGPKPVRDLTLTRLHLQSGGTVRFRELAHGN